MAVLRGTDAITHCLKAMSVKRVYGLIGTSIVGFLDGLYEARDTIRYISCRHEQVAGSMADAEGRLTRRPGIVALHSGPGSLNAMISLANAAKDCSPVIAITGSIKRRLQGCDGMLELDHVRVFRPICRAAFRVDDVRNIPTIFTEAWNAAMSGPGGPVLIEVPEDVWADRDDIDVASFNPTVPPPVPVAADKIRHILERLHQAARPLILAGAGVSYTHAEKFLKQVVEHLHVPVVTTGNGRGALSERHPLALGRAGYGGGNAVADEAMRRADFILGIGCTMSDITTDSGLRRDRRKTVRRVFLHGLPHIFHAVFQQPIHQHRQFMRRCRDGAFPANSPLDPVVKHCQRSFGLTRGLRRHPQCLRQPALPPTWRTLLPQNANPARKRSSKLHSSAGFVFFRGLAQAAG
ncbi:MAG TPA: thiamine pyrophosphate-binding protein [Gemmataceae bacterium]|nr:thiamine pyrophosphate-binding protein [Gemmataceae bacterium]